MKKLIVIYLFIYCTHFIQPALHEQAQNKEISLSTLGQHFFVLTKNTKLTNFIYLLHSLFILHFITITN